MCHESGMSTAALGDERVPVIVGVGEITERTSDPAQGHEPVALMQSALQSAEHDAGARLLASLDSLDIVSQYSWPYPDIVSLLNTRLGVTPGYAKYGEVGGESPVRFIHEAALRIARGEAKVAAVVGAEANYTVAAANKAGVELPWNARDPEAKLIRGKDMVHPIADRHGMFLPVRVYPFYENAAQAAWGQTQREGLDESGRLWSKFAAVAAQNSHAWLRKTYTPDEVTTPTPENRLIAWPYTKHMVANPLVNQGGAVLLTSAAHARALGIADEKWVYIWGGAAAKEPRDYLQRDQYQCSHAQDAVLEAALQIGGGDVSAFALIELYSCFPCVPKMARRSIGLSPETPMTAAGGLSFFGAPLNNYMTHGAAALVRGLRQRRRALALLYGQGEYVTKHHALVLSSQAAPAVLTRDYSVQAQADARRGGVPEMTNDYTGPARLETFTVVYGRDGIAEYGTVIARTPEGRRLMARVPATDAESLAVLTELDSQPVGYAGAISLGADELLIWTFA
jgi:acetyl-CoA acetyltransferase